MPRVIAFKDYPDFRPNLTPKQMFNRGAFGGTYFRAIYSSVNKRNYKNQHKEFDFLDTIHPSKLTGSICDKDINKYKVVSGSSLEEWENKGWIHPQDPYGWVQWYCRFYDGRRSDDDDRQIKRWQSFAGKTGRFRRMLINKIHDAETYYDDYTISPVVRQGLLQWAYELTEDDLFEDIDD